MAEEKPPKKEKKQKPKKEKAPKPAKVVKPPPDFKSIKSGYVQKKGL